MTLVIFLLAWGGPAGRKAVSQDIRQPQPDSPLGAATATRLIPLYYARDTAKVIATVRGPVEPPFHPPASLGTERLQMLADQRQRLRSQHAALLAQRAGPTSGVQQATCLFSPPPATIDRDLAKIERDLTLLDGQEQALRAEAFRFTQTLSYLDSYGDQPNSANALQIATARFQRVLMELRQVEAAVAAMRSDRLVLAFASSNRPLFARLPTESGDLLDAASFGTLADHVIEEQAARVLDLHEIARSEVAALDGQLKRLTTAFEDDLRRQFYKPALEDLRRHSSASKVRMGQIQTTTIRANDRMLARVSPGQTAVLDRPVHPVLLQEGLQVAYGLTREARSPLGMQLRSGLTEWPHPLATAAGIC